MAQIISVKVPDIGDFKDVPVIEVLVKAGDLIKAEDALLTLESDKATMEVPSPAAGIVKEVQVKVGDKVSEGTLVILLEAQGSEPVAQAAAAAPAQTATAAAPPPAPRNLPAAETENADVCLLRPTESEPQSAPGKILMPTPGEIVGNTTAHASPSVRRFARELGVAIANVKGSGPKGRITQQDVQAYVKAALSQGAAPGAAGALSAPSAPSGTQMGELSLLPWPKVDFAKFGPIETRPLARIKKMSGANLARNWVMIPHVTQFDEADITDLEAFRVTLNKEQKDGLKLTMLAFLIKASVAALKKFPEFNASLDGDNLVLKQYVHIGFAADTPNGLVVPVIRDADKKGLLEIAADMALLSKKARDGKLGPAEMQGGCFSISSLGGIGGTAFTPIINAPEVAILGVSKSQTKPVWNGKEFIPRMLLPLSLSYDHRVIDGASAARFTAFLGQLLGDLRRSLL
ncbi:MAG: dihydrolipoyllysine-residue acetyltransferase [Proteobacteria bacterium]|nr:dihydrolipoyllysine-residue acetyltransferase [Pseudomonadota bacterium]